MLDPFAIATKRAYVLSLIKEKYKMDPAGESKAYKWMNEPNCLLCGMTPEIYIDAGHGDKLILLLQE